MSSFIIRRSYSIAIIGPPASGKGTISKWLSKDFIAHHISTGDLLRQSNRDAAINSGSLASDTLVIDLLKSHLITLTGDKFCFDGFPRRKSQAEALDDILLQFKSKLELVILLNIPESVLIERIEDRWIHPASGRTYSYSFSPPKIRGRDDFTGENLIQRQDDLLDSFKLRMKHYKEHLEEICDFYKEKGILAKFDGNSSKEIYENILFNYSNTEKRIENKI